MKDWFTYRAERAAYHRAAGMSWASLAAVFGVPTRIVKLWVHGPPKQPRKRNNHCGYRETGSRDDSAHAARVAAHAKRIKEMGV